MSPVDSLIVEHALCGDTIMYNIEDDLTELGPRAALWMVEEVEGMGVQLLHDWVTTTRRGDDFEFSGEMYHVDRRINPAWQG